MKYFISAALLSAAAVQAQFDAASVVTALTDSTTKLTSTVNAYTGGDISELQSEAAALVQQIQKDDQAAKTASPLTTDQSLALAGPVQSLGNAAKTSVDAIVGKKSTFVQAGQGASVYAALSSQASASNEFSADLLKLVPESLRPIANNLAKPIADALSSGVAAFADQATSSSGSTATGSASSASSASSAATTEASSAAATATSSSTPVATMSSNGTAPTGSTPTSPIVMGSGSTLAVSGGVAALALLAALAL